MGAWALGAVQPLPPACLLSHPVRPRAPLRQAHPAPALGHIAQERRRRVGLRRDAAPPHVLNVPLHLHGCMRVRGNMALQERFRQFRYGNPLVSSQVAGGAGRRENAANLRCPGLPGKCNATRTTQTAASAAAAQPQGMPPRHDAVRQVGRWRALLLRRRLPHRHLLLDPVPLEARWRGLQPGPARQVVLLPGSPGLLQHLGRHVRQAFLWRPVRGGSRLCRWPQMLNNYLPMVRRRQQGPARLCCRLGRCGWAAQARRSLAGWL